MPTYGYTILYVDDVEATITFYKDAFNFSQKFITPEKDYAELDSGSTTLAFANFSVAEYNNVKLTKIPLDAAPPAVEIAFVVDDVAAAFNQAVSAGAVEIISPTTKPWGQTIAYVRDLNGFLIELCTAVTQ